MNTRDISIQLVNAAAQLSDDELLMPFLQKCAELAIAAFNIAGETVNQDEGAAITSNRALKSHLRESVKAIQGQAKPSEVFNALNEVQTVLLNTYIALGTDRIEFSKFTTSIEQFRVAFDNYVGDYSPKHVLQMLQAGHSLWNTLSTLRIAFTMTSSSLMNERIHLGENEERLTLMLEAEFDVKDFAEKLDALQKAYEEAGRILNVDIGSFPLRIAKIESGSAWIDVIGNAAVLALLIPLLKEMAGFIYRNYTNEGRRSAWLNQQTEVIDIQRVLASKLREAGLSDEEVNGDLQRSCEVFSTQLTRLLLNGQLEINGQRFEQQKLLTNQSKNVGILPSPDDGPKNEDPDRE